MSIKVGDEVVLVNTTPEYHEFNTGTLTLLSTKLKVVEVTGGAYPIKCTIKEWHDSITAFGYKKEDLGKIIKDTKIARAYYGDRVEEFGECLILKSSV